MYAIPLYLFIFLTLLLLSHPPFYFLQAHTQNPVTIKDIYIHVYTHAHTLPRTRHDRSFWPNNTTDWFVSRKRRDWIVHMLIIAELKAGWPSAQTRHIRLLIWQSVLQYKRNESILTVAIIKNETSIFSPPTITPRGVFFRLPLSLSMRTKRKNVGAQMINQLVVRLSSIWGEKEI